MQQFSTCETSGIAAALASTYDKLCLIERNNGTQGSLGYQSSVPLPIATVYVGLKAPTANILALYASQIGAQVTWQVRAPLATDIKMLDILIIEGQTLTVQVVLEPQSFDFEINVLACQVKGQGQVQNG